MRQVAIRRAVRVRTRESRTASGVGLIGVEDRCGVENTDIKVALEQLSPNQRAAVVLHYFEDLPVVEVAEAPGVKPATASVHLHRARVRLGELLGEEVTGDVTR